MFTRTINKAGYLGTNTQVIDTQSSLRGSELTTVAVWKYIFSGKSHFMKSNGLGHGKVSFHKQKQLSRKL